MQKLILCLAVCLCPALANGQQRIDDAFTFQTDPSKDYSLYIPSNYTPGVPHQLMLALHPWNTARWNAVSWCDTLVAFAEANGLILACPDGGADGKVDDPIDVAFTTALLDSMEVWYEVDVSRVYAMGFSWGARAMYTYGLSNVGRFAGFIPIGAAINGTNEVTGIIQNAGGEIFYLVHGALDNPNVRFHPIRNELVSWGAIVGSLLMPGVGHTIDFPNRNQILTDAFLAVQGSVSLAVPNVGGSIETTVRLGLAPNPVERGEPVLVTPGLSGWYRLEVFDVAGRRVWSDDAQERLALDTIDFAPGAYFLRAGGDGWAAAEKLVVR